MSALGVALANSGGPRVLAGAIAFVGGLRFVKWAVPFVCERLDKRAASLSIRERAVERRMNLRLKHVEIELGKYRSATMLLVNAFAQLDPGNRVLSDVARILSEATPLVDPDPELDALLDELDEVPGTKGGKQ